MTVKRILIISLTLLVCLSCFASCAPVEQGIGKALSGMMLDYTERNLARGIENPNSKLSRLSSEEIARLVAEYEEAGITLVGEITGGVLLSVSNEQTGYWGNHLTIGFSSKEDSWRVKQYYDNRFATELEEGRAVIKGGNWWVGVAIAAVPIPID